MDIDVMDSLEDLGYSGTLLEEKALKKAIEEGQKSSDFINLIAWLATHLQAICNLESCISFVKDAEAEANTFLLELSSFLKELECPYKSLTEGAISQRLLDSKSRITLLDYLCSELHSARIVYLKKDQKENDLEIEMDSSTTAIALGDLIKTLEIKIDVDNNPLELFDETEKKLKDLISTHSCLISEPALEETLTEKQWSWLIDFQEDLLSEYRIRREMLLTRLDVTIQSFKWGEGSQGKEDKIAEIFLPRRKKLKIEPSIDVSDILAARKDIFIIEKTSSAELVKNTKSSLNRVLIPHVPDRGGRPKEQRPPVEMPSWQKRTQPRGGGRGHFHGDSQRNKAKSFNKTKKFKGDKSGNFDAAGSY